MTRITAIHSFRGGTGKSNITANLAYLLAAMGRRVAVVDTDIQSPGIHVIFGLQVPDSGPVLNDYLLRDCDVATIAYPVAEVELADSSGALFLVPSRLDSTAIADILNEGYEVERLNRGLRQLGTALQLDDLLIDTHPGINEETLLSMAISDVLIVVLRPDQQDYQGTSVAVEVARRLSVATQWLIVNKAADERELDRLSAEVAAAFELPVVAALPLSLELVQLASSGLVAVQLPEHVITQSLRDVANLIAAGPTAEGRDR